MCSSLRCVRCRHKTNAWLFFRIIFASPPPVPGALPQALTPNLLARTIETVEGGGLVILLLKTVTSLKQLYAMSMDVHSR